MLLCGVIGYGVIGVEEAAVEVEQPFGAGRLLGRAMCCVVACCPPCPMWCAAGGYNHSGLCMQPIGPHTASQATWDADGIQFTAPPGSLPQTSTTFRWTPSWHKPTRQWPASCGAPLPLALLARFGSCGLVGWLVGGAGWSGCQMMGEHC